MAFTQNSSVTSEFTRIGKVKGARREEGVELSVLRVNLHREGDGCEVLPTKHRSETPGFKERGSHEYAT